MHKLSRFFFSPHNFINTRDGNRKFTILAEGPGTHVQFEPEKKRTASNLSFIGIGYFPPRFSKVTKRNMLSNVKRK